MQNKKNAELDLRGLVLVVVVVAWLAGIVLASWVALSPLPLLIGACAVLVCLIPLWRNSRARLFLLIILWLLLGAWRYAVASPIGDPQAISAFIGTNKLDVRGDVTDEPKLVGRTRLLVITVRSISKDGGATWQDAHGQLDVQTLGGEIENPYGPNYGDSVELQGKIQGPLPFSSPGIFASMVFPRINVSSSGGNPLLAALYHLRVTLANIIEQALPQPEAAQLIAILLGLRTPALKSLAVYFNVTGTAHLIASSGFKVTVLAGLVIASTRWLYEKKTVPARPLLPAEKKRKNRRRWAASALVIASIAAYAVLNGGGPAAQRAGLMGILLVVAPRFGRIYNVYTALAASVLLMSMFDPFVLWDAGFLLSFLGTLGIVLLTPFLQRVLKPLERLPFGQWIAETTAVTLAAQIATLPIMALTFNQVSFIAPIANLLTVPLLGILIFVGLLICGAGLLFAPLGLICGWVAWPILWYVINIIIWCASLPGAFMSVSNLNSGLAWGYYGLLALVIYAIHCKWPQQQPAYHGRVMLPASQVRLRLLQLGAALFIILATGTSALAAAQPDGLLTVSFLTVEPANQAPQGEAILIHTPDSKNALIDGGIDATSLGQQLNNHLPSWQHSLDMVILTSPKSDHLGGLQDVVSRYQIGEVVDGGMLHPTAAYALWRRTISERNIPYVQVRQGASIVIGSQVSLQIFWPRSTLHKGSKEEIDNGLVVRLTAPGLSMLLLGVTALSKYSLTGLMADIAPRYLQADIVQVVAEVGKAVPAELGIVLQAARPSLVVITPAALNAKLRKAGMAASSLNPLPSMLAGTTWQTEQTAMVGTIEIQSSNQGWGMNV